MDRDLAGLMNSRAVSSPICILMFALFYVATCDSFRNVKGSRRAQGKKNGDFTTSSKDKKGKTLTMHGLKSVMLTEADNEFNSSNSTLNEALFQAASTHQFQQALNEENNTLAYMESTGNAVPLPTYPFLICNQAQNISGYQRYEEISIFGAKHTEALLNSDEISCWVVQSVPSNASALVEQNDNLSINAVGPFAKIINGVIKAINEGATDFLVQLCPGALLVPGHRVYDDPTRNDNSLDRVWRDILSSLEKNIELKNASNNTETRKLQRRRSLVTENFFWTHLLEQTHHLQNNGRNLLQQIPRAAMWVRALQEGIDSSNHCSDMLDALHMSPLEDETSFRLQIGGSFDVGSGSNRDHEDSYAPSMHCVLSLILGVASHPSVCSVVDAPAVNLQNHEAAWIVQSGQRNERPWFDAGIRGRNQVVAVADTGIDSNHCYFSDGIPYNKSNALDFTRRKVIQYKGKDNLDSIGGHGTHTSATIAGSMANGYGKAEGIARDAKLVFFDISDDSNMTHPSCCNLPPDWTKILSLSYSNGTARVQNFSWGSKSNQYNKYDQWMDSFIYNNPDFVIVTAAGNAGVDNGVGSPGVAKNVITVGSTFSGGSDVNSGEPDFHYLSTFSSRGPTADGRMKPDLVAPGQWILSAMARPDLASSGELTCDPDSLPELGKSYGGLKYDMGTSMATPVVSGTVALIRQYFEEGWYINGSMNEELGFNPSAALVKAILINGAQSLLGTGNMKENVTDYDNNQGFGKVNLKNVVPFRNNSVSLLAGNDQVIKNSEVHNRTIQINLTEKCKFNVFTASLVWTDPPAAPGCSSCVLNNLDLSLIRVSDGSISYPNGLDTKDSLNNAERIRKVVNDQEIYTIRVEGSNLSTERQDYALVASGCFQLLSNQIIGTQDTSSSNPLTFSPASQPDKPVTGKPSLALDVELTSATTILAPLAKAVEPSMKPSEKPTKTPSAKPNSFASEKTATSAAETTYTKPAASLFLSMSSTLAALTSVTPATRKPLTHPVARTVKPSTRAAKEPTKNSSPNPSRKASTSDKPDESMNLPMSSTNDDQPSTLFSLVTSGISFSPSAQSTSAPMAKQPLSLLSQITSDFSTTMFSDESPTSLTSIIVYNALTDEFLCEVIAADGAKGCGFTELPTGIPLRIAYIDSDTSLTTETKIITLN